ncbi:MAG: glycosyltransferase, partial [Waterburya sp.]
MEFDTIADSIFLILGIMVLIPCLMFFIECLAAFIFQNPPSHLSSSSSFSPNNIPRPKTTILIPAHNEAEQITKVIQVLQTQLTEQDQVIVIADNCHDDTAELARATGVTVLEREHKTDRGKGYALAFA